MRGTRINASFLAGAILLAGPLAGTRVTAAPLAPPVSIVRCGTDFPGSSLRQSDPFGCSIGGGGALSSFGKIVESPIVSLVGEVSAFGSPSNAVGAFVTGSLDYEFQVLGGNPGDVVPVLVSTNLDTIGRDVVRSWGFASLNVGNVFGLGVGVAACTTGLSCAGGGESFHGTVAVLVQSGGPNATVHVGISAFAGSSPADELASVSADPYIFVDPSFEGAGLYSIAVSPGVANVPPSVPEPSIAVLLVSGLFAASLGRGLRGGRRLRGRSGLSPSFQSGRNSVTR